MERNLQTNLTILLFVIFVQVAFAQPTFQKKFLTSPYSYSSSVQQTFDGGYIAFGSDMHCWLIKMNANGDTTWTKSYGTNYTDVVWSAQQTKDSGFIAAGYTNGGTTTFSKVYLIKTNSFGDTLWTKTYGQPIEYIAYSVKQTNDGGYIVCGSAFNSGGHRDCFLLRTNSYGDTLWTKKIGSSALGDNTAFSVIQTFDNGFIFCGRSFSFNTTIVKTDSVGSILWSKVVANSEGSSIIQTLDSNYVIGGSINSDFSLMKINSIGDIVWSKTFGNNYNSFCFSVIQTSDGGIIGAGMISLDNFNNTKIEIVKTNINGDTIFTRTLGSTLHSASIARCINETSDKGFILSGQTSAYGGGSFYVLKTDSLGYSQCNQLAIPIIVNALNIQTTSNTPLTLTTTWNSYPTITSVKSGCSDTTLCSSNSINDKDLISKSLEIYPNPSQGNFSISFQENIMKGKLEITNPLGVNVFSETIFNQSRKEIDLKNILQGIYFVRVFDGQKHYCKKLIVVHN